MPPQELVLQRAWLSGAGLLSGALAAFFVALWLGRGFVRHRSPGLLPLSCGSFFWGAAGLVLVPALFNGGERAALDANVLASLYHTFAWLAAVLQLTGAIVFCIRMEPVARPRAWLIAAGFGTMALLALLLTAFWCQWAPLFLSPTGGGAVTRSLVLGSAATMLLVAAVLLCLAHRPSMSPFIRWYSLALLLMAAALLGLALQGGPGVPPSWAARAAYYGSALYLLAAVMRSWAECCPPIPANLNEQGGLAGKVRLTNVLEAAKAGIWDWNIQTGELSCNERWAEIAGYSLAELEPMDSNTWLQLVHPDDLPVLRQELDELFAGIRPFYDQECRIRHRDGHWVWVQDWGKVIDWTEDGKPLLMTGFYIDISTRKLAEERLRDLTRELQILLQTVPVGIAKYVDRRLLWCSRSFAEMLGYSKEEVHLKTTRVFPSCEEYKNLGESSSPILAQGLIYEGEQRLTRKDGSSICVRASGRAVDPGDLSQGYIWAFLDISERKLMEEAIRERAELFQVLFTDSHSVKMLIDPDNGKIINANKAASAFYGYAHEQLTKMRVSDINALARTEVQKEMARAREQQGAMYQFPHRLASGEIRDVEVYCSSIQIGGRTVLYSIVHDVTEKKRLEDSLRENQALLHSMTESALDLVYIKDLAGRYLMCNRATYRSFGCLREDILGKDDLAFFSPEEADKIMVRDRSILASGEVWAYEEGMKLAGHEYIFLTTKGPVRNATGAIVGLFGISRDITGRKHMEQELQLSREAAVAANLAKDKLLSTAAHEFRTPLSLLQSSLDILDRYGKQLDEEERTTQKRHIRSATQQLTDLAESLLAYRNVELETGQKAQVVSCDIRMLSRTIAEETQAAKAAGHEFIVTIGEECGLLRIDPTLYRRVLENLLTNAFRYTPPDRQVSLEVVKAGDRLRLTVADQGIGIEQGDLKRIFDPFFRGSNVGQRRGIGLGLSIIHESLTRMGGVISIASTSQLGSKFEVSLPWQEVDGEDDQPGEGEPGE